MAITPAAGFVNSVAALFIGLGGGVAAALAVRVKFRLGYDDSLDVVGVHGVAGVVGTLAVGLLRHEDRQRAPSPTRACSAAAAGIFSGVQALTVVRHTRVRVHADLARGAGGAAASMGLRVPPQEEIDGLDTHIHLEAAYDFGAVRAGARIPL